MPTQSDLLHEIVRTLGRLENGLDRIREDFQEEKENAHESRAVIHRRLDEQGKQIAKTEETIAIAGFVDAQIRDEVKILQETVTKNHKEVEPALSEWRRIKLLGTGVGALLLLFGISVGSLIVWASDTASAIVRHWLKL
ncbi:DUF1515 domain-containing protein [Rhizobium sp. AB2/73]|uniref:DUF1515 domain-containing protein n=1 Tax=Rhizobium sp. AB2/73 TaxID=2795216 RepID=UPI001C6032F9|nr:DUF1515 domain-containing protein [Rhizobium sp. AB2/73]QYA12939.1 DUF1515 domain-containing protein [Rhizobium sp. AB2/73]UEQ81128.1 DUF1515 domain-containing protein [Rhizobium sp. AB2/73]